MARRRRKLTTPVLFPLSISSNSLSNSNTSNGSNGELTYELSGIILHTGTALGGHYRSYNRVPGSGKWVDCNDASVVELDDKEVSSLFWYNPSNGMQSKPDSGRDFLYENAYMLLYTVRDSTNNIKIIDIPQSLRDEVNLDNVQFKEFQQIYDTMKNISVVTVYGYASSTSALVAKEPVVVESSVNSTITELTSQVVASFITVGVLKGGEEVRLRKLNKLTNRLLDTFTNKENATLNELGFEGGNYDNNSSNIYALEIKDDVSLVFSEYNPNQMSIRCFAWEDLISSGYIQAPNSGTDSGATVSVSLEFPSNIVPRTVIVPGELAATVGNLRAELSRVYNVNYATVNMIRCSDKQVIKLEDDDKLLSEFNIVPDDEIVLEILPEAENWKTFSSVAFEKLLQLRRNITILFNNPNECNGNTVTTEDSSNIHEVNYSFSIRAPLETTLLDIKSLMCDVFKSNNIQLDIEVQLGIHMYI